MKIFRTPPWRRATSAAPIEPLEDRIAPASTVTLLASGDITVLDGMNANDTITISLAGANLHFFDPSGIIAGSNAVQVDTNNVEVPANALLGTLIVDTGAETPDRVTFAPGLPLLNGVQVHTQTLTPLPALSIGPDGLDLTTSLSPIFINGSIDAGGNSVALQAGNAINTSAAATVIAGSISAIAVNGITLRMDADFINATNGNNGGITLTELNTITVGTLDSGNGGVALLSGLFQIGAGGNIIGGHALAVNGSLDLNGSTQTVGAVSGTGNIGNSSPATATLILGVDGQDGTFNGTIGGTISVVKAGSGAEVFSGPQSYQSLTTNAGTMTLNTPLTGATIQNNGGTLILNANAANSILTVNATTLLGGGLQLGALNIGSSGFAQMATHAQGGNPFVLDTQALTIASGGKLDLANNAMIVRGGDVATITAQIASGYAVTTGGYWDGQGINSSAAAGDPLTITALGVIDNNNFGYSNLVGVPLSGTGHDIIVRFTYYGDADLNGVINGVDYGLANNGLNSPGLTGWMNGDFDYDGAVTASDFAQLDNANAQQAGGPGPVIHQWTGANGNDWFDPANWTNGVPGAADTAVLGNPNGPQPQIATNAVVAFFDHVAGSLSGIGSLTVGAGMTWLGGIEAGGTTFLGPGATLTLGGSATKLLDGRLLTLPANTVSNTTGLLQLDNNAILLVGGTLSLNTKFSLLAGNATIDTGSFDVTLAPGSSIDGTGGLAKVGTGTLTLNGTNTYNGVTNILDGTLTSGANNRLSPNSAVFVNGGTLALGTFDQTASAAVLNTGSITGTTGKLNAVNSISLNGGTVTADLSASTISISNANVTANLDAGAGAVTLDSGAWKIRSSYSIGSVVQVNGGTLDLGTFTLDAGALNVTGGNVTSTNGTINSFGLATVANATINANLKSSSGIVVNSGTVNGNLDGADTSIVLNGGTVTYTSSVGIATPLTVSGGNLLLGANSVTFGGITVNSGSIIAATGTLASTGAIDINGGTVDANFNAGNNTITLNGGALQSKTNLTLASILAVDGGVFILGDKTMSFGGVTFNAGSISGTGTLISATDYLLTGGTLDVKLAGNVGVVVGPGAVVLTNNKNSFTGTVTINSGSLQIASNAALGDAANALDIEGGGTLITTASITTSRHIIANGAAPTINVTTGTVKLNGLVDGTGALHKTGAGNLLYGGSFVGSTVIAAGLATTTVGGVKVKFTGAGIITLTVVPDGMGGTRVSTVELADTDATTLLAINGPKAPATTIIDTILSLDPNDEIGTIKLGKTVIIGNGVNDAIADVDIRGKVNKLLFNDVNSYSLFELGKGLPYNNIADDTTPDTYNNHPDIKLRNVLGTGVILDITGNGIAGDQPGSIGGGGLGKVLVNQWDQPGLVKTTQSIGQFKFKHGDCNVVFEVDKDEVGALTTAGIGKMLVPNGAWGSSGSIVEGNVTVFSAGQFLAAANITAGSMTKLLVKKGSYLGTTTLKNPDAPALGTFSVNGDYLGYVDSAQAMINLNIKGAFKGSLKAKSIGSISAYSFNGTTTGDGEGDPLRHNIFVTDGSLGTIKTSAGGIKDFEIAVATVFNGFYIQWPTAPGGAVGIDNVTVAAGQINNTTVNLALGVPNALSYGIKDSVFESAGSIGNLTSSHSVSNSIFAATTNMGNVTFNADLIGSKLLAGTSLGGDGVFDGDETYTRAGKIGDVKALGTFGTTSIAVGVDPGAGFIYGDGDDVAAPGIATPKALGALTFGAASGGIFGPAGIVHTDAIEAATIKSLKVGAAPILKTFVTSHYIRAGGSEVASDVLVQIV